MKKFTSLDDLSFTFSYGGSGNSPKAYYAYYSTYGTNSFSYLGTKGVYPSSMELSNYRWENVVQTDVGLRLSMFKGDFTVDADVYRKRTNDMLFSGLGISTLSGFDNIDMNVGTMDNQGWEITLNSTIVKKKDFLVQFNFNIARNTNIIRKISEFYPMEGGDLSQNGQYQVIVRPNNPFGSFYGYKYEGVYKDKDATIARDKEGNKIYDPQGNPIQMKFYYPSVGYEFQPGDAKYEDVNHDGNINYQDVVLLGDANPLFTGGFGTTFKYKNLRLSTYFHYRYGNDILNSTRMTTENMYSFNNQSTAVLKRWRKEGDVTNVPRALYGYGYNWLGSDRFIENGSFLRFKSVTLSYSIMKGIEKIGVRSINMYATLQNLLTWTNYTGQDPEVSFKPRVDKPFAIGYDDSKTPPARSFIFGMTVQF